MVEADPEVMGHPVGSLDGHPEAEGLTNFLLKEITNE